MYLHTLQAEAEAALAEAMPALLAAKQALDELDKNDVTEIRAFATPPKPVRIFLFFTNSGFNPILQIKSELSEQCSGHISETSCLQCFTVIAYL